MISSSLKAHRLVSAYGCLLCYIEVKRRLKFSIYSKSTSQFVFFFFFFGGGGDMSSSDIVDKKSDVCNVQSDLDLHRTQKVIMLCLAAQGLIHPKLNDVLLDLWRYYE